MKTFCVALLASLAVAEAPLPDQAVATTAVWTEAGGDTPVTEGGAQNIATTVTAMTDADGVGSMKVDSTVTWAEANKNVWQQDNNWTSFGYGFSQTTETTETAEDGTETTTSATVAEWAVCEGGRARNNEWESTCATWNGDDVDFSKGLTTTGATAGDAWTVEETIFLDTASDSWTTWTMNGTKAFDAGFVTFENGWAGKVWGATWKNQNKGRGNTIWSGWGNADYTVTLEVPAPEPEPVEPAPTTDTGAAALTATAACALAMATLF